MGPELMDNMRKQAERFGAEFRTGWVNNVDMSERPFKIQVEGMGELVSETLILSTGASAKYLGIPGEKQTWAAVSALAQHVTDSSSAIKKSSLSAEATLHWKKQASCPVSVPK